MGKHKSDTIKKKKLVMVYWTDAYVTTDDDPELDGIGENLTLSVGWIVKKTKKAIYLSHFLDGIAHEFGSPYTVIPKGMIKYTYELERKDEC